MSLQPDDFKKTRPRAVWDAGDYDALSTRIADVGERVVARVWRRVGCAKPTRAQRAYGGVAVG